MAKTLSEIVDTIVEAYKDLNALNGQGVDRPASRQLAQVASMLEPHRGQLLIRQARIESRSQPRPAKADVAQPAAPAELGKPQGAQPVRQPQPPKVEPEQAPQSVAPKSEDVAEAENVVAAEPLTEREIDAMLALKPIEAEEIYSADRVRATLVEAGFLEALLEDKTYRQLYNLTRNNFA